MLFDDLRGVGGAERKAKVHAERHKTQAVQCCHVKDYYRRDLGHGGQGDDHLQEAALKKEKILDVEHIKPKLDVKHAENKLDVQHAEKKLDVEHAHNAEVGFADGHLAEDILDVQNAGDHVDVQLAEDDSDAENAEDSPDTRAAEDHVAAEPVDDDIIKQW